MLFNTNKRHVDTERGGESVLSCSLLLCNLPKQIVGNPYLYHHIQYELFTTTCNLSMRYMKSRHVSLIKAFVFHGMYHISLCEAYIIIYLLYMAYINIISENKSKHQTIWTQEFLCGNLVTREKTTEASLSSKIYFTSNCWMGQQPLTITLPIYCWNGQQPFYTITFPVATRRGYNPYTPTM